MESNTPPSATFYARTVRAKNVNLKKVLRRSPLASSRLMVGVAGAFGLGAFAAAFYPGWYILPALAITLLSCIRLSQIDLTKFGVFDVRIIFWGAILYSQGISPFLNVFLHYYVSNWADRVVSSAAIKAALPYSLLISFVGVAVLFILDSVLPESKRPRRSFYGFSKRRTALVMPSIIIFCASVQIYIFGSFGGIAGYLSAWTEDRDLFDGYGVLYLLSEPLPILAFFCYVAWHMLRGTKPTIKSVVAFLSLFLMLKFLFGGMRGSRSNTLWGVFWAIGIINIYFYRVKTRALLVLGVAMMFFMTSYTLYKSYGVQMLDQQLSVEALRETGRYDGRPIAGIMLEDFSRSGIQAAALERYFNGEAYRLRWGETYLGALSLVVPASIYPGEKPETKVAAGGDLLYGESRTDVRSSRIFGAFGEGILNFSPYLAWVAVMPLFVIYRAVVAYFHSLRGSDIRLLLYPLFANALAIAIVSDSDNLIFFLFKNGVVPMLCLMLVRKASTHRLEIRRPLNA